MTKHKVLSTKKLDPAPIELAKENGIDIAEQEFISVKAVTGKEKWEEVFKYIEQQGAYVVFTSANAVSTVKKYLHPYINYTVIDWKIFSIAGKTKEAVEKCFDFSGQLIDTAENAAVLANKIRAHEVKEIIFFCGDQRRDELPDILKTAGITVHEVVVYQTVETPVAVDGEFDAVLFFSPSAVNSFFSVNQLKKDAVCFAIGPTTADAIRSFTNNKIVVSESPDQEVMMSSMVFYFKNINNYE